MDRQYDQITIPSSNDFEFGVNRAREILYRIYNKKSSSGLVVYIPGFGNDLGEYTDIFCKKIAEKYNIATLVVEYFCINCRPNVGAEIEFQNSDIERIKRLTGNTINQNDILASLIEFTKTNNTTISITASLRPKRDEYQNFGILAALDILNAISDAVKRYSLNEDNIILIGSSYGGYLGNLVTKISPGFIRAVFDNSSWANPNLRYIVGRELNQPEFILNATENIAIHLFVKSPWTLTKGLPNSFFDDKFLIRSFSDDQIRQMAEQGGTATCYLFYHSKYDQIAPTSEKIVMATSMLKYNFKNLQMEIAEESDVDGTFIKSLQHGMEMSMITFFDKAYAFLMAMNASFTSTKKNTVCYTTKDSRYCFFLSESPISAAIDFVL